MTARWYAVKCQPRREALAAHHLGRQGFATLLPMLRVFEPKAHPGVQRLASFFPGYLFVRLDLAMDRWRSVNGTLGVMHLVQFGARPSEVPQRLIDALSSQMDETGVIRVDHAFARGDAVRLHGGQFHGYEAIFSEALGGERVVVLLSQMSRVLKVELPADGLEPAT
jgi:transcriptional antiterminator RfaH